MQCPTNVMQSCRVTLRMLSGRIWRPETAINWEKGIVSYFKVTALYLVFSILFKAITFRIFPRKSLVCPSRVCAILACAILLATNVAFAAPDLLGGTATAEPGQEVFIPVDFVADGSVVALQYDLLFNSNVLSITNVSSGAALVDHVFDWQLVAPGNLRVVITTTTLATLNSGSLATLTFRIDDAAPEGTEPLILQQLVLAESTALAVPPTAVGNGSITILPPAVIGDEDAVPIPATTALALALMIFLLGLAGYVYIKRGPRGITLSIVLGLTLFSSTIVRSGLFPGDANGDGNVDVADIPVIVSQILELSIAPGDPDCNEDLMVDVRDTICVAQPPEENQPPVLAPIADQQVVAGQSFEITASATDPDVDDVLTYSLDVFPTGMTINPSTGQIAWVPSLAQLGANSVTVRATDPDGLFDTEPFQVTVIQIDVNRAPDLIPPGNRVIQANVLFTTPLFATDPDVGDVLTFGLTNAPAGMAIDASTGLLSWSPSGADLGINAVTATVMDADGLMDSETFSIEVIQQIIVADVNTPPQLTVPQDQTIVFGNLLDLLATATDADVGDTLTFALVNNPTGMVIDAVTGAITWTPLEAQIGLHDVAVKVTDTAGAAAFGSFIVTVLNINRPPLAVDEVYQARIGETLTVEAPGVLGNDSDPDSDTLTAALVSNPANGVLDFRADGSFDYLPGLPEVIGPVELEVQCDIQISEGGDYLHNGTVAVGDVDNDGELEIVGIGGATAYSFIYGMWIVNASDCSRELSGSPEVVSGGGLDKGSHPGLLDIDGDGDLEIIAPRPRFPAAEGGAFDSAHLMAVHHDGTLAWPGNGGSGDSAYVLPGNVNWSYAGPTFADLDADGTVEILMVANIAGTYWPGSVRHVLTVINSVDGSIKWEHVGEDFYYDANPQPPVVADLDLDGTLEVILHTAVLDHLGSLEYTLPADLVNVRPVHLYTAVANFDADPYPEIVARDVKQNYLFNHDGSVVWKTTHVNGSVAKSQITVADFDGDGEVEFAYVQTASDYNGSDGFMIAYDTDGSVLWSHEGIPELVLPSGSRSKADNITAFDANGDGAADLVIHYETGLIANTGIYFFDGRDGSVLHFEPFDSYATSQRFMTVVDVDDDGEAELISSYTGGIEGWTRVWQGTPANPLPPAPPLRNQWVFNQSMVKDDATIITDPSPHWLQPGMNGYNLVNEPDKVYSQLKCEVIGGPYDHYANATMAVGDVDNDGDIEIVGSNYISSQGLHELWLLNADDCSPQIVPNASVMLAAGGFTNSTHLGLLDIDGDSDLEIIGVRNVVPGVGPDGDHLLAIHHDGSLVTEWSSGGIGVSETIALDNAIGNSSGGGFYSMGPTFADLDANGTVEIIMPWYTFGSGGSTIQRRYDCL